MAQPTATFARALLLVAALTGAASHPAPAQGTGAAAHGRAGSYTLAVIGDTEYPDSQLGVLARLISFINTDSRVAITVHVGDIKPGSGSPCTDAYFADVRSVFDRFRQPLVYTPGDNEWTDCHVAAKFNGLYTPTERLHALRRLFFPIPGQTLGERKAQLRSEAAVPAHAAYVENLMWTRARVVFATLNLPGSNNDLAPWGTPLPANAGDYPSQVAEYAARARANAAWVARAFATATRRRAAGVVLAFQADMWDTSEASLSGFDSVVRQIGTLAAAFGRPVLLLEGDSHVYRVDHPFTPGSPLFAVHPATPVAGNVTRLVVEGSDHGTEYLRLVVDPAAPRARLFTWRRVPLPSVTHTAAGSARP